MDDLKNMQAFVDFVAPHPLPDLAKMLSESLFAGIEFVGLGEGIWDEVPAMRLEKEFLGLHVELGGKEGSDNGFTLQVETTAFPWNKVEQIFPDLTSEEQSLAVACDISGLVREQLIKLEGIELRER